MTNILYGQRDISVKIVNYVSQHNDTRAIKLYEENSTSMSIIPTQDRINIYNSIGIAFAREFRFAESIQMYKSALTLIAQTDNPNELAVVIENLSAMYLRAENILVAEKHLKMARLLYLGMKKPIPYSLLCNSGTCEFMKGDYSKALAYHEKAFQLYMSNQKGKTKTALILAANLAWDYMALGNSKQAAQTLEQVRSFTPTIALLELDVRLAYCKSFFEMPSITMEIIKKLKTKEKLLSCGAKNFLYLALAELARRNSNFSLQAKYLEQSLKFSFPEFLSTPNNIDMPPHAKTFQIRCQMLARAWLNAGNNSKAWFWLERGNLQEDTKFAVQESCDPNIVTCVQAEQRIMNNEQAELSLKHKAKKRIRLEKEYEDAKTQLRKNNPTAWNMLFAERINVHPDDLDQIKQNLEPGTLLLEIAILGDQLIFFICVKNKPVIVKVVKMQNLGRKMKMLIARYRNAMSSPGGVNTARRITGRLYKLLFEPIQNEINKFSPQVILFAPSGILRYISLATLYDGKQYLVEKYAVANITGYDLVRLSKSEQIVKNKVKFVAFANPDGSLPSSEVECEKIASLFSNKSLFVRTEATRSKFLTITGTADFVHVATHGVLNPSNPQESYLVFSDEKLFYKDMIAGIPLMSRLGLLILSACSTATSSINNNAMEIYGMAYQFVKKSNSGATIATLWKVDDKQTQVIMLEMYKNILSNANTYGHWKRAESLARAQRHILKNKDFNHPFYWGAFLLIGNYK